VRLEVADLMTDGGRREAELVGGLLETKVLGRETESPQAAELHEHRLHL